MCICDAPCVHWFYLLRYSVSVISSRAISRTWGSTVKIASFLLVYITSSLCLVSWIRRVTFFLFFLFSFFAFYCLDCTKGTNRGDIMSGTERAGEGGGHSLGS